MEVRVEHLAPVAHKINVSLANEAVKVATEAMKNQYVERRVLDVKA